MTKDMIFLLVLLTAGALAVLSFWLSGRLRKACQRQRTAEKRLSTVERQLAAGQDPPAVSPSAVELQQESAFAGSLQQADLRLRLQQGQQCSVKVIERYRLMASMARRGLTANDICAVLLLSSSETEQLLKLSQLGHQAV